jgi:hypothetical protein
MKSIKLLGAAFLSLSLLSHAGAQTFSYSTDFSGANFQSNYSLPEVNQPETQGNWYNPTATASPYTTTIVAEGGGTNYLNIGGYFLGANSNTPAGFTTYAMQGIDVQSNSVQFNSIFQVNPGTTTKDNFGWTLFNTTGYELISVDLNAAGTNATGVSQYTLGVTSFAGENSTFNSVSFFNNGTSLTPLLGNTSYHLGFNVYNIGESGARVDAFSYNSGNNAPPTYLGQAIIQGSDWSYQSNNTTIGIIGASWTLNNNSLSTAEYGNNFMAMNTLAVSSIPEPQTWVLFGLSGLILVVAIRRRANS